MPRNKEEDKFIIERMENIRELLREFDLRLRGHDPGVTAYNPNDFLIDFGHSEWAIVEPLMIEVVHLRAENERLRQERHTLKCL